MFKILPYISVFTLFSFMAVCETPKEEPKTSSEPQQKLEAFQPFTGRVIGKKVRLRAASNTQSVIIQELNKNDLVLITGQENEFWAVSPSSDQKLYVFRSYLLDNTVEAHRVNVRLKPGTDAPIVGVLGQGQKIEGVVCKENPKWLELASVPAGVHFFVAKDYVTKEGDVALYAQWEQKKEEATKLFHNAKTIVQEELKKPFNEMAPETVISQLETIIKDYSEFSSLAKEAQATLTVLNKDYQKKKNANSEEQKNLTTPKEEVAAKVEAAPSLEEASQPKTEEAPAPVAVQESTPLNKLDFWKPMEEAVFATWSSFHSDKTEDDFYQEQEVNSSSLAGIIEPYSIDAKNKPGDFVLKKDGKIIGFLYSTKINLEEYVGKNVSVSASQRPNNNFAFPAYFVNSVQ